MLKRKHLPSLLGVAALTLVFGVPSLHAQSAPDSQSSGSSGAAAGQSATGTDTGASGSSSGASAKSATAPISKSDRSLIQQISISNMAEIEAGKLAQNQSKNEQVQKFAQQMVDDHTKAQDELQQLAKANNVTVPTELDAKHKAQIKKLSGLSGEQFDKRYVAEAGGKDHKETRRLLQKAQTSAQNLELKAWAEKTLPTVEQHLTMAQQIQKSKASTASGSSSSPANTSSGSPPSSNTGSPSGESSPAGSSAPAGTGTTQ